MKSEQVEKTKLFLVKFRWHQNYLALDILLGKCEYVDVKQPAHNDMR